MPLRVSPEDRQLMTALGYVEVTMTMPSGEETGLGLFAKGDNK
jgi:hypothetical protein